MIELPIRAESVLKRFTPRAKKIYEDRDKMDELLRDSEGKSRKFGIRAMYDDIKILRQLLSDYRKGQYRAISKSSILLIVAGLTYLITPIDILPDFILGLGFMDDAVVLGYVIRQLYDILDQYKTWKRADLQLESDEELEA